MSSEQTIKDLRATADLIERNGLAKGRFFERAEGKEPPACPMCSLGGINTTVWGDPHGPTGAIFLLPDEEYNALGQRQDNAIGAFAAHVGTGFYKVPEWNDADERTQEEVVSAFRDAADALEAAK